MFTTIASDVQPFDEVLDRRIFSLGDQQMHWEYDLGVKRRTVPGVMEALVEDVFARQREADEEEANEIEVDDADYAEEEEEERKEERRWEDIEQAWRKTTALANEMEQVSHTRK